ncbi:hypothetical protein PMG11_09622 [Penicillium brasilianum]|uniref:HRQ family protein 2 n=1 Tax=Penicillium brasilianum TaxID=104259 RepID=A0A0F7TWM7_PENBI|nr:hypothetical protein PMG11_09622 [Penicillium brasilianum]
MTMTMMTPISLVQWPGWPTILCFSLFSSLILLFTSMRRRHRSTTPSPANSKEVKPNCYPPVEALPDFHWQSKEPVKIRPFKPKYNLTMSIQETAISELIEMDKNYLERITLRKKIMAEQSETVLGAADGVKDAVDEFYVWLVGIYLPTRYPTMFHLLPATDEKPEYLRSLVTDERYPVLPHSDPRDTLRSMGGLIDDDLLFLLPSDDGDSVTLKGFVTCCPNGFNTAEKLNLKLRDIHTPVPQYKERLEKSMDRFFDRIKVGRVVKRANWTIQNTDRLFRATGNHGYEGEKTTKQDLDLDIARVRVERQFLHRLPRTRALLFSFKTLLYPLSEIREEGLGEALAEAIDGLKGGNAPGFHFYKRAAVWGESAKAYLRG